MSQPLTTAILVPQQAVDLFPHLIPADGRYLDPQQHPSLYAQFHDTEERSLLENCTALFMPWGQVVVSNQQIGFQAFQALAPMPDESDVVAMTNANDQWLTSSRDLKTPQHLGFTFKDMSYQFTSVGMLCRRGTPEAPMLLGPSPKALRIEATDVDGNVHVVYEVNDLDPWQPLAYYTFQLDPVDKPCTSLVCIINEWHPGARSDLETGLFRLHVYGTSAAASVMPVIASPHPKLCWVMEEPSLRPADWTTGSLQERPLAPLIENAAELIDLVEHFGADHCRVWASSEFSRTNPVTKEIASFPGANVLTANPGKPWVTAATETSAEIRLEIELPEKARLRELHLSAAKAGNKFVTAPHSFSLWGRTKEGPEPVWIMLTTVEGATTELWTEGFRDWFVAPGTMRVLPDITPFCSAFALVISAWNESVPDTPEKRPYFNSLNHLKLLGQLFTEQDRDIPLPASCPDVEEIRKLIEEAADRATAQTEEIGEQIAKGIEQRLQEHTALVDKMTIQRLGSLDKQVEKLIQDTVRQQFAEYRQQQQQLAEELAATAEPIQGQILSSERVVVVDLETDVTQRMTQALPGFFDAQPGDVLLVKSGNVTLPSGLSGKIQIKRIATKGVVKIRTDQRCLMYLRHEGQDIQTEILALNEPNEIVTLVGTGDGWHLF